MYLKELGLYYYKARVYHPQIGRFLQTDPIGYKDDMDIYSYVGNDPMNKTDQTGTTCVQDSKGVADCKVNDPGRYKSLAGDIGKAYSNGVNKLLKGDQNRSVTLNVKGA